VADALIGLLGVVAGGLLTGGLAWVAERERRKREVVVAAARCLDRLEKLDLLEANDDPRPEIALLGENMDAYLTAMAAAPGKATFKLHYDLYQHLRPMLIRKSPTGMPDLTGVPTAIAVFRKAVAP
jgi:hypothetical protein